MKQTKSNIGAENRGGGKKRTAAGNALRSRRRFIFGARAAGRDKSQPQTTLNQGAKAGSTAQGKVVRAGVSGAGAGSEVADLTETLKALLQLAREQGQLTYDDINDILPDGVSPDNLDALYTKLHDLGIEIVARVEGGVFTLLRTKPFKVMAGCREAKSRLVL